MFAVGGVSRPPAPSSTNRFSPSAIPQLPWVARLARCVQSLAAPPLSPQLRRAPGHNNGSGKFPPPGIHQAGESQQRLASIATRKIAFFGSYSYLKKLPLQAARKFSENARFFELFCNFGTFNYPIRDVRDVGMFGTLGKLGVLEGRVVVSDRLQFHLWVFLCHNLTGSGFGFS